MGKNASIRHTRSSDFCLCLPFGELTTEISFMAAWLSSALASVYLRIISPLSPVLLIPLRSWLTSWLSPTRPANVNDCQLSTFEKVNNCPVLEWKTAQTRLLQCNLPNLVLLFGPSSPEQLGKITFQTNDILQGIFPIILLEWKADFFYSYCTKTYP